MELIGGLCGLAIGLRVKEAFSGLCVFQWGFTGFVWPSRRGLIGVGKVSADCKV